jgi:hypothetical protein
MARSGSIGSGGRILNVRDARTGRLATNPVRFYLLSACRSFGPGLPATRAPGSTVFGRKAYVDPIGLHVVPAYDVLPYRRRGRDAFHASISARNQATLLGPSSIGGGNRPARMSRHNWTRLFRASRHMPRQPRIRSPTPLVPMAPSGATLTALCLPRLMINFTSLLVRPRTPDASRRNSRGQFRGERIEQIN